MIATMRLIAAVAVGIVVALTAGFTAANVVPDTRAGDGAGTISGYTVTKVQYHLDNTNPQQILKVDIKLDAAADAVKVRLQTGGTWYNCTPGGDPTEWTCNTPGQQVAPANELRVVAVKGHP